MPNRKAQYTRDLEELAATESQIRALESGIASAEEYSWRRSQANPNHDLGASVNDNHGRITGADESAARMRNRVLSRRGRATELRRRTARTYVKPTKGKP